MVAGWLNATLAGFDLAIFAGLHGLAEAAGWFFTPFFMLVSLFAEKGIGLFLVSAVLMLFKNTRKAGLCMFLAVLCGAVITNLVLKDLIARPRPFADEAGAIYGWWMFVGSPIETSFSFPSGHTTATMAAMTGLFLCLRSKARWLCFIPVALMGLSRSYLMVHYPSDVIAGVLAGAAGAGVAYLFVRALYRYFESHPENRICSFALGFDVRGKRSDTTT